MNQTRWAGVLAVVTALSSAVMLNAAPREVERMTVTGCLIRAEPSRDVSTTKFLLTHTRRPEHAVGTSGHAVRDADVASIYRLADNDAVLSKYANHRVELSGTAPVHFGRFDEDRAL